MNLFKQGQFKLHSGENTNFKIDCDALTNEDLSTIAMLASKILPEYCYAIGVPSGGESLAILLNYSAEDDMNAPILLVDDVLTTGNSMEQWKTMLSPRECIGFVIFARSEPADWITPLFRMTDG